MRLHDMLFNIQLKWTIVIINIYKLRSTQLSRVYIPFTGSYLGKECTLYSMTLKFYLKSS